MEKSGPGCSSRSLPLAQGYLYPFYSGPSQKLSDTVVAMSRWLRGAIFEGDQRRHARTLPW